MRVLLSAILVSVASVTSAFAAGDALHPKEVHWHFDGPFGTFDKPSIQRGFQVYKEVCASCHSLKHVAYRNLEDVGFSAAEVKAIAAEYTVMDGPNDDGDMFERAALPSDRFVSPFDNEKAAAASNGGAYPPDLSVMAKARHDGPNYIFSLLTGYKEAPEDFHLQPGLNYNPYFPNGQLAMAAPLADGLVTYVDGTEATKEQMARDVVNFLQWTAEPEMEERKRLGLKALMFLAAFTVFFYISNKRAWASIKGKEVD